MDKIWLEKAYPPDVPHEINENVYPSLNALFLDKTMQYKDNTAFINMGVKLSYGDLESEVKAFAAYLQQDLGLKKGDKFAIMVPNCLQYPIAIFGAFLAGIVVVNVNPLYTARELEHQLNDSEASAILIVENFAATLEKVISKTGIKHVVTTQLGDMLGTIKGSLVNFVVKHVKKLVPTFKLQGATCFNQALKKGRALTLTSIEVCGDDLAFLQYTGGTTGPSKGAMLTHKNMIANTEQARVAISPIMKEGQEFVVTALPLYHIFALTANCFTFIVLGGTNLLITNPRDMPSFVKALKQYPFTALTGVNTLFNGLLNTKGFNDIDFSHLKLAIGGGMSVQKPVADRWRKMTNTSLLEGYGLTECAPLVCLCPYNQVQYNGTIGMPVSSTDISIRDDKGEELSFNEPGELWVKGPQVMKGYYNRDDATAEVMHGDWFATGDIACVDENGIVKIVDRKKDIIIVSGFNVFPNEIEEVVMEHDGVLEVAAVGVPHEVCGEAVKIFVTKKDPSLTAEQLIAHCRESLTSYKIPKLVEFRYELPKTNVGKILRRELR